MLQLLLDLQVNMVTNLEEINVKVLKSSATEQTFHIRYQDGEMRWQLGQRGVEKEF